MIRSRCIIQSSCYCLLCPDASSDETFSFGLNTDRCSRVSRFSRSSASVGRNSSSKRMHGGPGFSFATRVKRFCALARVVGSIAGMGFHDTNTPRWRLELALKSTDIHLTKDPRLPSVRSGARYYYSVRSGVISTRKAHRIYGRQFKSKIDRVLLIRDIPWFRST